MGADPLAVVDDLGNWEERGRGHGYQMCRVRDAGPYAVNNVYIATGPEYERLLGACRAPNPSAKAT